jgi:hypothetical protein
MPIELSFDMSKSGFAEQAGISDDRRHELDKAMCHAVIDFELVSEVVRQIAKSCNTVEELVVCVFFIGMNERG